MKKKKKPTRKISVKESINKTIDEQLYRIELTKLSHLYFFVIYFCHYVKYQSARFHRTFFELTEREDINTVVLMAFRGSSKSTIFTLSYPLWAIFGKQQKKFVVIIGQTQRQARLHLSNIRRELESNELLRKDYGPFKEEKNEWGAYSIFLPWYNARISAVSMEQTIRGMRNKEYRPDLIICDDIEDITTVRNKENRDNIYNWITGEIIPAGDQDTKYIFIGNLLHQDSLLMRLKEKIINNELNGEFFQVPLLDENDRIAWPGKYPDIDAVEAERKKIANESAWQREYLLHIIPDDEQVVHPEWIFKYKDSLKELIIYESRNIFTGVDAACVTTNNADYTAMVSAVVTGHGDEITFYILPNPIHKRMEFPETIETIIALSRSLGNGRATKIFVESESAHIFITQQLKQKFIYAEPYHTHGIDKRTRLVMITQLFESGKIRFPEKGCEQLIQQILGFGVEKHDDLVDALIVLVLKVLEKNGHRVRIATHKER